MKWKHIHATCRDKSFLRQAGCCRYAMHAKLYSISWLTTSNPLDFHALDASQHKSKIGTLKFYPTKMFSVYKSFISRLCKNMNDYLKVQL